MKTTTAALVRSHHATRKLIQKTNDRIPHKAALRLARQSAAIKTLQSEVTAMKQVVSMLAGVTL